MAAPAGHDRLRSPRAHRARGHQVCTRRSRCSGPARQQIGYDQDLWVQRLHQQGEDPGELPGASEALRAANLRLWERTAQSDRARIGVHSKRGAPRAGGEGAAGHRDPNRSGPRYRHGSRVQSARLGRTPRVPGEWDLSTFRRGRGRSPRKRVHSLPATGTARSLDRRSARAGSIHTAPSRVHRH